MKSKIYTTSAPAPIGPYSQAVKAGGFVFVSGQIPLDPATGELETNDIEKATRLVMNHIHHILQAAGSDMDRVVKATIFLSDMNHFAAVNRVYGSYFTGDTPPARETVEVARLPKDVPVEISVIALAE
ncbi:MAG: RidA family protein [Chlorobi bacterium]|nr:RidA family protein [Chlorobiota bacterium]